eukprot:1902633-Amphidinium_carterae.1
MSCLLAMISRAMWTRCSARLVAVESSLDLHVNFAVGISLYSKASRWVLAAGHLAHFFSLADGPKECEVCRIEMPPTFQAL